MSTFTVICIASSASREDADYLKGEFTLFVADSAYTTGKAKVAIMED